MSSGVDGVCHVETGEANDNSLRSRWHRFGCPTFALRKLRNPAPDTPRHDPTDKVLRGYTDQRGGFEMTRVTNEK